MNKFIVEPCASVRSMAEIAKKRINRNFLAESNGKVNTNDKIFNFTRKIILSSIKNNYFSYIDNEELFKQIFKIIINEDTIHNPIGQLINGSYYDNLCKENQQRYIFKLSHIYILIKQTYIKVQSLVDEEV